MKAVIARLTQINSTIKYKLQHLQNTIALYWLRNFVWINCNNLIQILTFAELKSVKESKNKYEKC